MHGFLGDGVAVMPLCYPTFRLPRVTTLYCPNVASQNSLVTIKFSLRANKYREDLFSILDVPTLLSIEMDLTNCKNC